MAQKAAGLPKVNIQALRAQVFERRMCENATEAWMPLLTHLANISNILVALNSAINILIYVFKVGEGK